MGGQRYQFRTVFLKCAASEESPENRKVAQNGELLYVLTHFVVKQACNGETLPVRQFDDEVETLRVVSAGTR